MTIMGFTLETDTGRDWKFFLEISVCGLIWALWFGWFDLISPSVSLALSLSLLVPFALKCNLWSGKLVEERIMQNPDHALQEEP